MSAASVPTPCPFPASLATVFTAAQRCPLANTYKANTHTHKYTQTHTFTYTHSLTGPRIETNLNERSSASHGGTTWNETVAVRLRHKHEHFANLYNVSEVNLSELLGNTFDIFDIVQVSLLINL